MKKDSKIFVAGHRGMVGSAIVRQLKTQGFENLLLQTSAELDLTNQAAVHSFFSMEKPEYVFLAAAKVGGILANSTFPADFAYQNSMIQNNVLHAAYTHKVTKLLFLGSSCIYPREAPQPIPEEALLTGPLEETNEAYALAKINGLKMCEYYRAQHGCNFIAAMPTNLYGPNDNFDLKSSHVLPALLRKFHQATYEEKEKVILWGTGTPLREFHFVDDLAEGLVWMMQNYSGKGHLNIGSGEEISIRDLAEKIKQLVGFEGEILLDPSKPDGTPRKVMDSSRLKSLGWEPKIFLDEGLEKTYEWFVENEKNIHAKDFYASL